MAAEVIEPKALTDPKLVKPAETYNNAAAFVAVGAGVVGFTGSFMTAYSMWVVGVTAVVIALMGLLGLLTAIVDYGKLSNRFACINYSFFGLVLIGLAALEEYTDFIGFGSTEELAFAAQMPYTGVALLVGGILIAISITHGLVFDLTDVRAIIQNRVDTSLTAHSKNPNAHVTDAEFSSTSAG